MQKDVVISDRLHRNLPGSMDTYGGLPSAGIVWFTWDGGSPVLMAIFSMD